MIMKFLIVSLVIVLAVLVLMRIAVKLIAKR